MVLIREITGIVFAVEVLERAQEKGALVLEFLARHHRGDTG
jgi:hypothetical protein